MINPKLKESNPDQYNRILEGFKHRSMAFGWDYKSLGCYNGDPFRVGLDPAITSVFQHSRPFTKPDADAINDFTAKLTDYDLVSHAPSNGQFACNLNVQPKKGNDGVKDQKRICTDYRNLNSHSPLDRYPMPLIEQLLHNATCKGQNIFTTLDLLAGFLQCKVHPDDIPKTAFWGADRQLYVYNRMAFGLRNAPSHFQRCVDKAFRDVADFYIDDSCVSDVVPDSPEQPWGSDVWNHALHVFALLDACIASGFTISAFKFHFGYESAELLGHRISQNTISPVKSLVAAIEQLPEPTNRSQLQSWLGLTGYYRKFIPNYSAATAPLRVMLSNDTPWSEWGQPQSEACARVKHLLTSYDNALRVFRDGLPTTLATDWSVDGMGAVLSQIHPDGTEHPVAYASRSCNKAERNYTSYKGEMLAAVWAVEQFKYYLTGRQFTLLTDHQPLSFLMKSPNLSGIYARWALRLQEFDFTISYRPGSANANADIISRFPLPDTDEHWEQNTVITSTTFRQCQ
jgi:hypothetical protein